MPTRPSDQPFLAAWKVVLQQSSSRPAVLDAEGRCLRTFAEIEAEAGEWARHFEPARAGSVVALQIGNAPQWPALILALFRLGLVPLPVGSHLERKELREALALCGARALVTAAGGACQVQPLDSPPQPLGPETEFLKLTSGTTGAARAIRFTAAHLLADGEQVCDSMGFGPDDLNYAVIPISHSYGFSNLVVPLLCRGVAMALSEDRLPRAILAGLAASGATVFPGMPVIYDKLAGLEDIPPLPRLRLCISAGAPLSPVVATRFTEKFGRKIHTFYGSSECGGIAYDATEEPVYEEGFLGTPMHGVEIKRAEEGEEISHIEVRSRAVGLGYWPEDPAAALGEGRFIPGDLIRRGTRGLSLTGRISDVINIAGRKLNPAEVEIQMAGFPGLRQAVVFGVPSSLRGEEPVACVAGEQIDRAALQRFCHAHLSQWQMPRDFWIVDEIPANERGKISRRALAAEYLARPGKPAR